MIDTSPYQEDDASQLAGELFSGKLEIGEALARLRTRLLDLSMRNRLLNYRHPKGRSLQIVGDPNLNLLFERLEEGKPVSLVYVPDPPASRYDGGKKPDVRVFARELGIGTSFDIAPSPGPTSYKRLPGLQVLQYPTDLERRVRKISTEARTVIEETGTNMLYLMFGFLEYFDSDDSERAVLAPLLSMPVNLVRGNLDTESRTYLYDLTYSGEDIAENFTLREKLRQQFRLELPELSSDDTPEDYLGKIQAAVSKRRNWAVKRRLSLGFLSFGKLAIWADLDPAKSENLLSSKLLRDVFQGGRVSGSDAFHAEDYDIDEHADGELPLIYDADSSQHSAIIDVKNGKSLVINGPPGTGKSQTITNIIACAISNGKKVLFVSEKLAALEVVKRRLEAAGLGDFCLELHSHKTQKKQLLKSVEQRMAGFYPPPTGYAKRVEVLRERRKALNAYAELLGSRLGSQLDLKVHDIFWITERKRQALDEGVESVAGFTVANAQNWSAGQFDKCRLVLGDAASALEELGCQPMESPWVGFKPQLLIKGDEFPIIGIIDEAMEHAREMSSRASDLARVFGGDTWTMDQLKAAAVVVSTLGGLPKTLDAPLLQTMFVDGLKSLERVEAEVGRLSSALGQIRLLRSRVQTSLARQTIQDAAAFQAAVVSGRSAVSDQGQALTPQELTSHVASLEVLLGRVTELSGRREISAPADLVRVIEELRRVSQEPASSAWWHVPCTELKEAGTSADQVASQVQSALNQVSELLKSSNLPFTGKTEELQALLEGRGMPELLPNALVDGAIVGELHRLNMGGWGEWTAEQFLATARNTTELVGAASEAAEQLKSFFARLAIPVEATKSWLDSVEILLKIAEAAPKELLGFRGPGLDRPDFADIAIRAEDSFKNLTYKASKVGGAFHLDTLPDEDVLKEHVQIFRRGDSFFNFLRSDWRRAKAAYQGCAKQKGKLTASLMGDQFAAVLAWKRSCREFEANDQFRSALGSLFVGVETDFSKARRLHSWLRESSASLLTTDAAQYINLTAIPEQHIALICSNATRVRGWISQIKQLSQAVVGLPGLDPALTRAHRIDELFSPLAQYAKSLDTGGALLRGIVRPTASVKRAVELVGLRRRIEEHDDLLRALVKSPTQLAAAGASIGMPSSSLSYQDLARSVAEIRARAQAAQTLGEKVATTIGAEESPQSALEVLEALQQFNEAAIAVLASDEVPRQGSLHSLVDARARQLDLTSALLREVLPYAKADASLADVIEAMQAALDAEHLLRNLNEDQEFAKTLGAHLQGESTEEEKLGTCLYWARSLREISTSLPGTAVNRFLRADVLEIAPLVVQTLRSANISFDAYQSAMARLNQWGEFSWMSWGGAPTPTHAVARLERAREGADGLVPWSKYLAAQDDAESLGVGRLVRQVADGYLLSSSLVDAFEYVFFRTLSRGILSAHRELARFSGQGHESLRSEFAELDKELIAVNGAMYAAKVHAAKKTISGVRTGRVGDLTEMALLTKETNKQKRHIPIRQLLKRAGRSLLELKPCFMMGPLSVAQYLEQGYLKFDLVVMDEASQLRPEDALGALARGNQLVVVGDPKQLPPTNFFSRLMEDDNEDPDDEPAVVDGVESILGICEHLYRPVRTLRWHYRSQHESLIAFSNSQFYDSRLVVFPSPYKRNKRLGVNYRYVHEGVYQDRRNLPEAQRVVDAVVEHMLTCPEESLGVVTLNQTQRELIEDLLDKRIRDVKGVSEYFDRHEKAGWKFFVKNLENVQGDERDVIFVSTTFGKPPGSTAVRQNFGPINRPDGWRRLNVLFTRARKRLDLFSSMLPSDVVVGEKVSLGRRALQEYLKFAKSGELPQIPGVATGREADSDFEVAVADALRHRGYESEGQVGVAGYFIDLGVRHPERHGEFLAGIECDGATYHSSLSARDRDRIRQEILESLGWRGRMIRVWSTDWFSDPEGQIERLVQFLEDRRAQDLAEPAPYSDEDLDLVEVATAPQETSAQMLPALPSDATDDSSLSDSLSLFIDVGDRVTYQSTSEPIERHTVQIVDSASNPRLGLINECTPLAQALLGLCRGDEAVLKVEGRPVRKFSILTIDRAVADTKA